MALAKVTDTNILEPAIRRAIRDDTERAWEEMKKELIERLDREKDTIIAGVVLNVMQMVSYETYKENLVITVRKSVSPETA